MGNISSVSNQSGTIDDHDWIAYQSSSLRVAIGNGKVEEVQTTLGEGDFSINERDLGGIPPIAHAALALRCEGPNALEILDLILEKNPDLNVFSQKMEIEKLHSPYLNDQRVAISPLGNLLLTWDKKLIEKYLFRFLELGADPNELIQSYSRGSKSTEINLVEFLLEKNYYDLLLKLITERRDIKITPKALNRAIISNSIDYETFDMLLKCRYVDLNQGLYKAVRHTIWQYDRTPANVHSQLHKIRLLIHNGADYMNKQVDGLSPLELAETSNFKQLPGILYAFRCFVSGQSFLMGPVSIPSGGAAGASGFSPEGNPLLKEVGKKFIGMTNPKATEAEILASLVDYIKKEVFDPTLCHEENLKELLKSDIKIIEWESLDTFIQAKTGVCRHIANVTLYVLQQLVEQGFLKGHCYRARGGMPGGGAHAWNVLLTKEHSWYIDAYWGKYHDGKNEKDYAYLSKKHGADRMKKHKLLWKRAKELYPEEYVKKWNEMQKKWFSFEFPENLWAEQKGPTE